MEHLFLRGLEGRACEMWSIAGITTDLEAAFPTDEKVIAFDSRSSALVSMSTVFARVYTLYLIYKYG